MVDPKLIKLYINNFIRGEINFEGIKLIPMYNPKSELDLVVWKIKNPLDKSYSKYVIKEVIYNSLAKFSELLGDTSKYLSNFYMKGRALMDFHLIPEQYLSLEFEKKIENAYKGEKVLGYKTEKYGILQFYFNIKNLEIEFGGDEVILDSDIKILKIYSLKDQKEFHAKDYRQIIDWIDDSDGLWDLNNDMLDDVTEVIWSEDVLMDPNNNMIAVRPTYYDYLDEEI